MGRVEGKVAVIPGAERGQGRSHAVRLAQEGADIIAVDLCGPMASVDYPLGTADDLAETVRQVESLDRRIVAAAADVRDYRSLERALAQGVAELGRLDIVSANAGILSAGPAADLSELAWHEMIDVNLRSVFCLMQQSLPHLIESKGNIVNVSSVTGLRAFPGVLAYCVSKAGVDQLTRCAALELAAKGVRVNAVNPGVVVTEIHKRGGMSEPDYEAFLERSRTTPCASTRPGFSAPGAPNRTSFMGESLLGAGASPRSGRRRTYPVALVWLQVKGHDALRAG